MWKPNQVSSTDCKDAIDSICACEHLLKKMKAKVKEHIDYGNAKNNMEFYEQYGKIQPSNADIIHIATVIRDQILDIKKKFEGTK